MDGGKRRFMNLRMMYGFDTRARRLKYVIALLAFVRAHPITISDAVRYLHVVMLYAIYMIGQYRYLLRQILMGIQDELDYQVK